MPISISSNNLWLRSTHYLSYFNKGFMETTCIPQGTNEEKIAAFVGTT